MTVTKKEAVSTVKKETNEKVFANDIIIRGFIVYKHETEKATTVVISTGKANKLPNYPKVVCFNENAKKLKNYSKGDNVTIYANMQSTQRKTEDGNIYSQTLFADDVIETPKLLKEDFGVDGNKYAPPLNEVKLAGIVHGIYSPSKNIVKLIIRVVKNRRTSFIAVTYFTRSVGKVMETIRVRDNVCVVGNIQTTKKVKGDEVTHYENIIVTDLQKIE